MLQFKDFIEEDNLGKAKPDQTGKAKRDGVNMAPIQKAQQHASKASDNARDHNLEAQRRLDREKIEASKRQADAAKASASRAQQKNQQAQTD